MVLPTTERTPRRLGGLTTARLEERALALGLRYPDHLIGQLVAALETGRNVILTGPPGTGKTTLAMLASEFACAAGAVPATASASWTTADTVGEVVDSAGGPVFRAGSFVQAVDEGRWLVIDELNRADVDKAFGALFTILSGQSVVLPHRRNSMGRPLALVPPGVPAPEHCEVIHVPESWRIIATMNEVDRDQLHQLSFALLRRFTVIEVHGPPDDVLAELIAGPGDVVAPLIALRAVRDLGPAVYLDAAAFAARRVQDDCPTSRVIYEALVGHILPQFASLDTSQRAAVLEIVEPLLDPPELQLLLPALDRLRERWGL